MSLNRTRIDWPGLDYTWNPVVGCKTGCWYCYAKRMNDRFKWIEKWDEPQFFPERLLEPIEIKKPSRIFVCSMADLFGDWISESWILMILDIVMSCPEHEFMFLTKYPYRYHEFKFPKNCWIGATVESDLNIERINNLKYYRESNPKKYISIEPITYSFNTVNLDFLDLVIVGAMTGPGAVIPKKEWIQSIKHHNIHYKENIKKYL